MTRCAVGGHHEVLQWGGDKRFLRLDRLEWLLEEVGNIAGPTATALLRTTASNGKYATVVRLRAEYVLVERGDLEHRYTLVGPIL